MSKLGDLLRAAKTDAPKAPAPTRNEVHHVEPEVSLWGRRSEGVRDSEDLQRILALPSRPPSPEDPEALVEEMTAKFRRPGSDKRLRPIQAFALKEAMEAGSLLGMIGVGGGKALLSMLLFTAWESRVGVLFVPASLLPKLRHDYETWAPHFRLPRLQGSDMAMGDETGLIYALSYSALSTKSGADLLERIDFDSFVGDEAHALAGLQRSSRRDRFRSAVKTKAKAGKLKHLGLLSGTFITRSIKPACGLGKMLFGIGSPFPIDYHATEEWSYALDPGPNPSPPGELVRLCAADETPRQGFRRRVTSTSGVVATSEDAVENGLEFIRRPIDVPPEVATALETLRKTWTTPTGQRFDLALEFSRYARQLASGIELYFTYPRQEPEDLIAYWFEVRAAWNKEVQDFLNTHSRRPKPGMDSPALLEEAAESGTWKSQHWSEWKAVRDQVQPLTQVHWISDFMVKDAVAWGNEAPGIIWTVNTALGQAIAKLGGFPWLGAGMEKEMLAECHRKKPRTIVASMDAHSTGNDMQAWNRQLFTYTSSNSKRWEQAVARCHRPGQLADTVEVFYYAHTLETQKAMAAARLNAEGVEEITGQTQKLLQGTWVEDPSAP